jgi:quinoprotein glucose dehydrogenase
MLYVPSQNTASVFRLEEARPELKSTLRYMEVRGGGQPLAMPQGLPLFKPPYSRMTAINMNTGEHAWMVPQGDGNAVRHHPMLKGLNLPPVGGDHSTSGPLLTKTVLISALTRGGRNDGPRLIARDKATGAEIASVDLPDRAIGTPMTYMVDGKQYVALTVGGNPVPELVAFALP